MEFTIQIHEAAEHYWIATVPQLPNLVAYGNSQRQAIERIKHEAIEYLSRLVRVAADNVYRVEEDA